MSAEKSWERFCKYFRVYPEIGLCLDISRMRFGDDYLAQMEAAAKRAFDEMRALESGAVANQDENRMVGHYWLRAPELAPTAEIKSEISAELSNIKAFARAIHEGKVRPEKVLRYQNVVVVGIGGSALGPQLIADALGTVADPMQLYFCDNTDPDGIARLLSLIEDKLDASLVIVISKSGGTVETRNGALELAAAFSSAGLSFARHAIAVTCAGSKLENQAANEGWLKIFHMWDWVGGRTSVLSPVGTLPAALQGLPIDQLLAGAKAADVVTRKPDAAANPAMLLALMWYFAGEGRGRKDMVVIPYKDRLVLFSKYLQQLVMESLGKALDRSGETVHQGIAVYGNKGSTDQHAYVQQLRDGVNNFFVTFIEVLNDYSRSTSAGAAFTCVEEDVTSGDYLSGFFQGTRRALYENGRDSITLTIDQLNAHSLGALIALYERAVGFYASLININAYHQPGVEAGKKAAGRVIELQRKILAELRKAEQADYGIAELAAKIGAPDELDSVYKTLEHLCANAQRGVMRVGSREPASARYTLR